MKTFIITALLSISVSCNLFAQETIARFKYEEAEEALASGNYLLSLEKITEVETILKGTNQKTLFLKINIQHQLFKEDYTVIKELKSNCNEYLIAYENNQDILDKYRIVYKINEEIKKFSDSPEVIEMERQKKIAAKKYEIEITAKRNKLIQFGNDWASKFNYEKGITFSKLKKSVNLPLLKSYYNNLGLQETSHSEAIPNLSKAGVISYSYIGDTIMTYSIRYNTNLDWEFVLSSLDSIRTFVSENFEPKYFKFTERNIYDGHSESMIVAIPDSNDTNNSKIGYYITFTASKYGRKSMNNIGFIYSNEQYIQILKKYGSEFP
jgi:hypothetical protein